AYFSPCIDRDVYLTPGFVAIAATIVMIVARALGSRSRWNLAQWRLPAKLFTATVLLTWVSVTSFDDWGRGFAGFHAYPKPVGLGPAMAHLTSLVSMIVDPPHWVVRLSSRQCDALLAGLVMIVFIASITVSCLRERGRRSRWLTVLEHPAVTSLAIAFAMAALVHATVTCEPDVAAYRAVFATVGAIIAYSGMLLRRRRREALS
ncbi:MAG TPA: hypothetical protein VFQ65_23130, partial [Kofleriaceae bacterium]|nr:hypothetical protein [Kofleriaceae bacterium]